MEYISKKVAAYGQFVLVFFKDQEKILYCLGNRVLRIENDMNKN